jgi:energy-coupling factor transporter transmembrane protein EcfT
MPTARGRLIACILAFTGAILAHSPSLLAIGYGALIVSIVVAAVLRAHIKFLAIIVLPLAAMALTVWPLVIGAPPGKPAGSDPSGAVRYALLMVLRVAFFGALFQATLLPLKPAHLTATLWRWGLRREWLITVLAAVILAPEMRRRAELVVTSGLARGVAPNRSPLQRLRLLLLTILPLTAWSLQSALHRADLWHERKLLDRVERLAADADGGNVIADVVVVGLGSIWVVLVAFIRWGGG